MKNTPYVNEVSSDEALLKRYRKEIMDLKKQLEEVCMNTYFSKEWERNNLTLKQFSTKKKSTQKF